ncbi:hypothetical protein D3C73_1196160 [compost metagenome]
MRCNRTERNSTVRKYTGQGYPVSEHTVGNESYSFGQNVYGCNLCGNIAVVSGNEGIYQCLPEGDTGMICAFEQGENGTYNLGIDGVGEGDSVNARR